MSPVTAVNNRLEGNAFEDIFKSQGHRCGLLVLQNHLTARYTRHKVMLQKSNLDFMVSNQRGIVGFFDTKSFLKTRFSYSDIDPHQIERAVLYNDYKIPAGFVVYFRKMKKVFFYSGHVIRDLGTGKSFGAEEGAYLGDVWDFKLRRLLDAQ